MTRAIRAIIALAVVATASLVLSPAAFAASGDNSSTGPGVNISLDGQSTGLSGGVTTVLLLGAISLIPSFLLMVTAFTRIVIVLGLTRTALNTPGVPPTQVIIGFSLFLTLFVMAPTFTTINNDALQPFLDGSIDFTQAWDAAMVPLREFMLAQTGTKEMSLMLHLSGTDVQPADPSDIATTTLVPAYVLSELRTAFLIGFVIFVPFLVIDLVVSAVLTGVGMVMLPPALVSLPFKLLLFVVADGWVLITESLVGSFNT